MTAAAKTAELTLESLGISEDVLVDKLVDRIAGNVMSTLQYDEDGDEWFGASPLAGKLNAMVKTRLDSIVNTMAEKHVLPRVSEMVEGLVLQETNRWGEKVGQPVTFIEYLTQRADAWMREEVSHDGKVKGQDSFRWRKSGTRVEYLIDRHLQYSVERAMKEALDNANKTIVGGLEQAVRIKLAEVADSLKVNVKTK